MSEKFPALNLSRTAEEEAPRTEWPKWVQWTILGVVLVLFIVVVVITI